MICLRFLPALSPVGKNARSGYLTLDNSVELYDVNGKLISITNVLGITQTLSYDANERLDRIDTNDGEYLQFGYDASNRIATITDHANRVWSYRYDANDNLEYVDNPGGTSKRYHYEDASYPHALTGITDERGIRYATWAYDTQGRANMGTHAGNAERVPGKRAPSCVRGRSFGGMRQDFPPKMADFLLE